MMVLYVIKLKKAMVYFNWISTASFSRGQKRNYKSWPILTRQWNNISMVFRWWFYNGSRTNQIQNHSMWVYIVFAADVSITCASTSGFWYISHMHMGLDARKPVFSGVRTTKTQTSLRIRAVWSAHLFACRKVSYLDRPPLNAYADVLSAARRQNFKLSLLLHPY